MELQSEMCEIGMLLDFYGSLLTDNTREVMDMHFNRDMSLGEISESLGISRQGAHSFVNRGRELLYEYESKLGMLAKFRKVKGELELLQSDIDELDVSSLPAYDRSLVDSMKKRVLELITRL